MNRNTIINLLRKIRRKYKVKSSYAIQIDETDDRAIEEAITIIQTKDIDYEKESNHIPRIDWGEKFNG